MFTFIDGHGFPCQMDAIRRLPSHGERIEVLAHGKRLYLKRSGDGDWHAYIDGEDRVRFGNAAEIRADVAAFVECGCLPRSKSPSWA